MVIFESILDQIEQSDNTKSSAQDIIDRSELMNNDVISAT